MGKAHEFTKKCGGKTLSNEKGDLCLAIPAFVGKRKRTFREEFTGDFI